MSTLDTNLLAELVTTALERTAFVMADFADPVEDGADFTPSHFALLTYGGAGSGTIFLEADDGFVRELAASLLGVEEDEVDTATHGQDALNELSNIVGGSVVIALGGDDHRFLLNLPQTASRNQAPDSSDQSCQCLLESENGLLRVHWAPGAASAAAA